MVRFLIMASDDVSGSAPPSTSPVHEVEMQTAGPPTLPPQGVKKRSPTWLSLSRRIAGRTTDLLAIGLVLVVSLTMGRQILHWWGADAPHVLDMGPLDNMNTEWGSDSRPVSLEFGDSPFSITRQVLTQGGSQAAVDAIRERCQQVLVKAGPPDAPPDKAELDQLEALAKFTPDIEQPGLWQLYTLGGGMVTVVGIKTFAGPTENLDRKSPSTTRRVICWGLVFPGLSPGTWTAYTFVKRQGVLSRSSSLQSAGFDLSSLQLPEHCQRTILMQEAGQTGLLGFQGRLDPAAWQAHFDRWLTARGWKQANAWEHQADGWSSRYVCHEAGRANESTIQIQFHLQNTDQGVGLIHWLPGRESPAVAPQPTSRGTP